MMLLDRITLLVLMIPVNLHWLCCGSQFLTLNG